MSMIRHARLLLCATFACLAACSRDEAGGPARVTAAAPVSTARAAPAGPVVEPHVLERARAGQWMTAIFGDRYDPAEKRALAGSAEEGYAALSFVSAADLGDGRVAVVVNGTRADETGMEQVSHAEGGDMHVYELTRHGEGWRVSKRHENVASLGSNGHFGNVQWVALAPGKPGFIVSSGGIWQGYAILVADIFALEDGVRAVGSFRRESGNSGACGPETEECWDIGGKIKIAPAATPGGYNDIVVDFSGERFKRREVGKNEIEQELLETIRQTARYRYDGKEYKLVAGTNPVPEV